MSELVGRTAIVTGASQGIGREIAGALAAEGANVVVTSRQIEALNVLVEELKDAPGSVHPVPADATLPETAKRVVAAAIDRFGALDILVNNVGGPGKIATFEQLTREDWLRVFELNVTTVVEFVREAIQWLRNSPAGRIVNIASIVGVEPGQLNPHYCASKAAVINLSKHLSNLLAKDRILVNVICPGQVNTEHRHDLAQYMSQTEHISLDEAKQLINAQGSARIPLGRIGEGEDIASLVCFLASEKASWMTGACLHVNGGKTRSAF